MGFVGNYALCGLSPQTDGMPVIRKKEPYLLSDVVLFSLHLAPVASFITLLIF